MRKWFKFIPLQNVEDNAYAPKVDTFIITFSFEDFGGYNEMLVFPAQIKGQITNITGSTALGHHETRVVDFSETEIGDFDNRVSVLGGVEEVFGL